MRKYLNILIGYLCLLKEEVLNGNRIKLRGFFYCICSGVKFKIKKGGECTIGNKNWLSENCIFECSGELTIGYNNFFNANCKIVAFSKIEIGDNNLFGPNVIIVDHNHKYEDKTKFICKQGFTSSPIKIGSNIWIGGRVTICEGVTIVDRVVVGANSVVTHDLLESGVYAGSPARKIKDI